MRARWRARPWTTGANGAGPESVAAQVWSFRTGPRLFGHGPLPAIPTRIGPLSPSPKARRRAPAQPVVSNYVRERAARESEGGEARRVKLALAARGLSPRKRFGQNFLVREELAERIVEHAHLREDDVAVEIGPGAGALTARIARRVRHLFAVEKDLGLADYLAEEYGELPRLELVTADFLEWDISAAARAQGVAKLVVLGNIPYNLTTPILEHLFAHRHVVRSAVLLVQKEYAQRLAAAAGTQGVRSADAVRALPRSARAAHADQGLRVLAAPGRGQFARPLHPAREGPRGSAQRSGCCSASSAALSRCGARRC